MLNSIAHWGKHVLECLVMRLLSCVLFIFAYGVVCAQPITDLGEISHQGAVQTLRLSVESPDANVQAQALKLFGLHGGVTLVGQPAAAFTLRFLPKGDRSVELIIESGNPPKPLFKQIVVGASGTQALLRACDLAIEKTLGIPGFFAGKLAFVAERTGSQEIYTADLLFSDIHKVTNDKSYSISPHWSPDGRYLTYTGYYLSEFPDLFLVDLSTGKRKAIATYKGTNTGGVFSPSGEQLAMILSSSGNAEVYIGDSRGRRPKRITSNKSLEASPTWSPDGQRLIFTSDQLGGPQLFNVDLRTKAQTRIPTNISRYCDEAVWNQRHPNLIAFTAAVNRSFQIALYNFNTRTATFLTHESVDCVEPCWASDGRHLFFTRRTGRDKQLHVLDTETGKIKPLHSKDFGSVSQASFVYPKSNF
jgi:TolB protein